MLKNAVAGLYALATLSAQVNALPGFGFLSKVSITQTSPKNPQKRTLTRYKAPIQLWLLLLPLRHDLHRTRQRRRLRRA